MTSCLFTYVIQAPETLLSPLGDFLSYYMLEFLIALFWIPALILLIFTIKRAWHSEQKLLSGFKVVGAATFLLVVTAASLALLATPSCRGTSEYLPSGPLELEPLMEGIPRVLIEPGANIALVNPSYPIQCVNCSSAIGVNDNMLWLDQGAKMHKLKFRSCPEKYVVAAAAEWRDLPPRLTC